MKRLFCVTSLMGVLCAPVMADPELDQYFSQIRKQRLEELRCTLNHLPHRLPEPPPGVVKRLQRNMQRHGGSADVTVFPGMMDLPLHYLSEMADRHARSPESSKEVAARARRLHDWTVLLDHQLYLASHSLRVWGLSAQPGDGPSLDVNFLDDVALGTSSIVAQLTHLMPKEDKAAGIAAAGSGSGAPAVDNPSSGWSVKLKPKELSLVEDTACIRREWKGVKAGWEPVTPAASLPRQVRNEDEWRAAVTAYRESMESIRHRYLERLTRQGFAYFSSSESRRLVVHLDFMIATMKLLESTMTERVGRPPAALIPAVTVQAIDPNSLLELVVDDLISGFDRLVKHHVHGR